MTDKQQIEELKELTELATVISGTIELDTKTYYKVLQKAKKIIALGYRNCKDKVVLSREEKQALEKRIEKSRQLVNELVLTSKSNVATYYGDVKYCLVRADDLEELAKQFGVEVEE